jgi:MFS family permease
VTTRIDDPYQPDSPYAYRRLALSLLLATIAGSGMWCITVVLTEAQKEFGVDRAAISIAYTFMMLGFATGTIVIGRMIDRTSIVWAIVISGSFLGAGYLVSAYAPNLWVFSVAHGLLLGIGAGGGFAPLMADISHWFEKKRGLAVVVVASGNLLGGTIWPLFMNLTMPHLGWRGTYMTIGLITMATMLPLSLLMRQRPSREAIIKSEARTEMARADLGLSTNKLVALLMLAGFSCCVAMSMPQVHIVAYCGDLGYGVARGAEMLSLMLFLGIISRVGSGIVADRIGGTLTLLIGSFMQGLALLLYLYFDGLTSLYVISGIFGLFQGGIVPMYAVICREFLPPREAGARIGLVVSSTMFGMAFGGYVSGFIYDLSHSYGLAFMNGLLWNGINLIIVGWLFWKQGQSQRLVTA